MKKVICYWLLFTSKKQDGNKLLDRLTNNQKGQAFIFALVILGLVTITTVLLLNGSVTFLQNSSLSIEKIQATNLAEAGIDRAVAALNATGGSYNGEGNGSNGTGLGNGEYSVSVTSINSQDKKITVTGYMPNKISPKAKKTISIEVARGLGFAFNYALQAGNGGLVMNNNSQIVGSVYSNGKISMSPNATITGDAYVAGGVQPNPDQQDDCTSPNCQDQIFGQNATILDAAQKFIPQSAQNPDTLRKVQVKLRKVGNPPNLTVKILGDFGVNHPDPGQVLATGFINAGLVSATQGNFVDVTFTTTPPVLNNGFNYWIVLIPASVDANNYWVWSEDTTNGYLPGWGMTSPNWNNASPTWNNLIPPGDLGFKTFMGGVPTSITGAGLSSIIGGDAHVNTAGNINVNGNLYYQIINPPGSVTVGKSLFPASADPASQPFPISDANIQDWENQATAAGVQSGFVGCPVGGVMKGKYNGDVSFGSNCTVRVFSPIWITGNLMLSNSDIFNLDPSYGAGSGVFIVNGQTTAGNTNKFQGTGVTGSYLMFISNWDSGPTGPIPGANAISFGNSGDAGIFYAPKGTVLVSNNNSFTDISAWTLILNNNVTVTYDQGLSGAFFSSGPSGQFSVVSGTYQSL